MLNLIEVLLKNRVLPVVKRVIQNDKRANSPGRHNIHKSLCTLYYSSKRDEPIVDSVANIEKTIKIENFIIRFSEFNTPLLATNRKTQQ